PSASASRAAWVVFPERSMPSSVTNTRGSYLLRALERARLVRAVPGDGFARRRGFLADLPLAPESADAPSESAEAPFFAASLASRARWRSSRFCRISTIDGQSSLRQSFQGRPRNPLTVSLGISPQIEQRSSSRHSS